MNFLKNMVEVLKLTNDGFIDEQKKSVNLSELELKLALTRPSSIGEIRGGKIFTELRKFGDRIGADYVFFLSDGYSGGTVNAVDIGSASPNLAVNYYCRRQ